MVEPSAKPSKLDNLGNKRHTFTKEDSRKGGKTMTPYRKFMNSVMRRKGRACNPRCPYWPCRYQPLCNKYNLKGKEQTGACALAAQEPSIIKRYFNLVLGKEDELVEEASKALAGIADGLKFIKGAEKVHKMRGFDMQKLSGELTLNVRKEVVKKMFEDENG